MKRRENRIDTGKKSKDNKPVYNWINNNDNKRISDNKILNDFKNDFNNYEEENEHNPLLLNAPPERELTTDYCHKISEWVINNINRDDVIMGTVHGSFLYGTAHEGSDLDLFVVVENGKNKSKVIHGEDVQILNLDTFTKLVATGSHQSIEALYSPYLKFNEESPYIDFIKQQRISTYNAYKKYMSAAVAFRERGLKENNAKQLNHADRLEYAAQQLLDGNYTPVYKNIGE